MKGYCVYKDFSHITVSYLKANGIYIEFGQDTERPNALRIAKLLSEYEVLIIGTKEIITDEMFELSSALKILATISRGTHHISEVFKKSPRITVINDDSEAATNAVAEHTLTLIMALQKKLLVCGSLTRMNRKRTFKEHNARNLFMQKVGVIGAGKIGTKVMHILRSLGVEVLCYTKKPQNHIQLLKEGIQFASLKKLAKICDIISVHIPLETQTKNLISKSLLETMKSDVCLINTSRLDIFDRRALVEFIGDNKQAMIGFDLNDEETDYLKQYISHPSIITPYMAALTQDTREKIDFALAKKIVYAKNEFVLHNS
jgi:phosphoglycerate dehydrogenase-like enzyme